MNKTDGVNPANTPRLANDTDYGLPGAAWTTNANTVARMMYGL